MAPKDTMETNEKDTFIGDAINIATRPVHTKLNKLILLRLPLAIPPRAPDSSSYVSGILYIAPLYICFESLWHAALHANPSSTSTPEDDRTGELEQCTFLLPSTGKLPRPSPRIHQILSKMFIPGLLRSNRLRADLHSLTNQSSEEVQAAIEEAASSGRLGEMVSHIRRSVEKHPHVLLSYAWVLYMALFSGGRFIRATLENAGRANHDFWGHPSITTSEQLDDQKATASHGPLQFFHFPTPQDGEDLKIEFKSRLAEQDKLLTTLEKEDIVKEANCIFENLILVIAQLDDVCHTRVDDLRSPLEELSNPFGGSNPIGRSGFRIRDSVLVAKERANHRQGGGGNDLGAFREEDGSADEEDEVGDEGEEGLQGQKQAGKKTSSDTSSSSSSSEEDSPTFDVDPEFAARLEKAVHFDAKLPVPQRTESGNVLLYVNGKPQKQQQQARQGSQDDWNDGNDGASDTMEKTRKLANGRAVALNIAVCLGSIAMALAMMYYRQ